ncbi:hypothetical protein IQ07DRAFT_517345, partial [Pyrenochaeta sp. DS3sAY3a]
KMAPFAKQASEYAGEVVDLIEVDRLPPVVGSVTWDEDPELLCSYSWRMSVDGTNAIYVPGAPRKWQEPALPLVLSPDSGFVSKDDNYTRREHDPFTPMFSAMAVLNPNYKFDNVDILADRRALRLLLAFVQGKFSGEFRLDLHLVSNTLVIVCNEAGWWTKGDGSTMTSNLKKVFTLDWPGMEDSTGHYRAIRYSMGPLSIVCRYDAHTYDDRVVFNNTTRPNPTLVTAGFPSLPDFNPRAPLSKLPMGRMVPTAQLAHITTRVNDNIPRTFDGIDRLWFGRTSLLYTGQRIGNSRVINGVKYENATASIQNWEMENQLNLRKLASLLGQLRFALKNRNTPNRAAVLIRRGVKDPLQLCAMKEENQAFDAEFIEKHWVSD